MPRPNTGRVTNTPGSTGVDTPPHSLSAGPVDTRRDFTMRSVFAVAFAFISPIIALYAIFNLGIMTAGPSFWWAFPVVLAGQLLVALVFGELSSRWPEEGGVYAWTRRLVGDRLAWVTGWAYSWTLICLNAAAAFAGSSFAVELLGLGDAGMGVRLAVAAVFVVLATVVNSLSRRWLKVFIVASIICEVVGSLYVGTVLLMFHRVNDWSSLVAGFTEGGTAFVLGPFIAALALAGWALIGFESAADLAAEVRKPERAVPLAQISSLVLVALTVMYACAALILAIPDLGAATAGQVDDVIMSTIADGLGTAVVAPMILVVCIGFLAGIAAVSAALSRAVHAMADRGGLPASTWLVRRSARDEQPRNALVVTSATTVLLLLLSVLVGFYDVMIAMSTGGFYVAFLIPVAAMLYARRRRGWVAGVFTLRRWSLPINIAAAAWLVFQVVNIAWPRPLGLPWYVEWGCVLMFAIVGALGVVVYRIVARRRPTSAASPDPLVLEHQR